MHTSKTLKRLLAVSAVAAMFSTVGVQAQTTSAAQTQIAGRSTGRQTQLRRRESIEGHGAGQYQRSCRRRSPRQGPNQ